MLPLSCFLGPRVCAVRSGPRVHAWVKTPLAKDAHPVLWSSRPSSSSPVLHVKSPCAYIPRRMMQDSTARPTNRGPPIAATSAGQDNATIPRGAEPRCRRRIQKHHRPAHGRQVPSAPARTETNFEIHQPAFLVPACTRACAIPALVASHAGHDSARGIRHPRGKSWTDIPPSPNRPRG